MSMHPTDGAAATSENAEASLYRLVQKFERQCSDSHHGKLPKIEDYLHLAPPESRADLLTKLLSIELPARSSNRNSDFPTISEYVARFPQHDIVIEHAFDDWPLDNYILMSKIGEGGMGKVYKARRCVMHDLVAVKVMSEVMLDSVQDGQSKFERFQREIRTVAQLVHPNIVRALDARRLRDGQLILVMELVDGITLGKLTGGGPLPVGAACEAVRQAALALDFAHTRGVVHRDVKSENLMATWDGVVKLLDLGLAKVKAGDATDNYNSSLTGAGVLGTPAFMAPEQWLSSASVDARVDVYALGCVLFHLLAGSPPWRGSLLEIQDSICRGTERRLDEVCDHCPPPIVELVAQAMCRDRDQRTPTAGALAAALASWSKPEQLREFLWAKRVDRSAHTQEIESSVEQRSQPTRTAARTGTIVPEVQITRSLVTPPSPSVAPAQVAPPRRPNRRQLLLGGAAAVGGAGLLGTAGWWWLREDAELVRAKRELVTLPGLHGEWWFVEMPWFTPAIRQKLVEQSSKAELIKLESELLAADTKGSIQVRNDLLARAEKLSDSCSPLQKDFAAFWAVNDPVKTPVEKATAKFASTLKSLQAMTPEDRDATDWHLGAILLHRLANLGHEKGSFDLAQQWYQSAITGYEKSNPDFAWLATADLGAAYFDAGQQGDAASAFRSSLRAASEIQPKLARVWLRARTSDAYVDDLKEASTQAEQGVTEADSLSPSHPLRVHAIKTLGWRHVDSLRFQQAAECFQQSIKLRPDDEREVLSYQFHDRHGLALCQYFLGHVPAAIAELQKLVRTDIPTAIAPGENTLQGNVRELVLRRLPNSLERLADCQMFGLQNNAEAAKIYGEALQKAKALGMSKRGNFAENCASLWYRQVIALTLSKDAAAGQEWDRLSAWLPTVFGPDHEIDKSLKLTVRREACEAIRKIADSANQAVGMEQLKTLITDTQKGRDSHGQILRDDLGIMLLAAEYWLQLETSEFDAKNMNGALGVLDAILALYDGAVANSPDLGWFFQHCFATAEKRLGLVNGLLTQPELEPLKDRYLKLVSRSQAIAERRSVRS